MPRGSVIGRQHFGNRKVQVCGAHYPKHVRQETKGFRRNFLFQAVRFPYNRGDYYHEPDPGDTGQRNKAGSGKGAEPARSSSLNPENVA